MNTSNTRTAVLGRVAALFAAVAMTTLTLGSQIGLVAHYTSEPDAAVLAAKRALPGAQNAGGAAPQRSGRELAGEASPTEAS